MRVRVSILTGVSMKGHTLVENEDGKLWVRQMHRCIYEED